MKLDDVPVPEGMSPADRYLTMLRFSAEQMSTWRALARATVKTTLVVLALFLSMWGLGAPLEVAARVAVGLWCAYAFTYTVGLGAVLALIGFVVAVAGGRS